MEVAGLAIGVAGVISLFQTCAHGYRTIQTALEMGDVAPALGLQFRVEEMRLELWGRSRGISFSSRSVDGRKPSFDAQKNRVRDNDILQIPQMAELVLQVLARICQVQEKHANLIRKYSAASATKSEENTRSSLSLRDNFWGRISAAGHPYKPQVKEPKKRANLGLKIKWALRDKETLNDMLRELKSLNDGLKSLLPREDAATICQSLTGEVINSDMDLEILTSGELGEMDPNISKTLELRRMNMTSVPQSRSPFSDKPLQGSDAGDESSRFFIDMSCFPDFIEPRIKPNIPIWRTLCDYEPADRIETQKKEVVLIEWRPRQAESKSSQIAKDDLARRRAHIASLLHRTAMSNEDHRVLNCLGFCLATGRLPDGKTCDVVGFVYQLPAHAGKHTAPISLRDMVGEAFASLDPDIPSLDDRYHIARTLAISLYQLQCSGWIHRKISSYNVLFFKDSASGQVDLKRPYLAGWQFSRPDGGDIRVDYSSETEGAVYSLGDFDMYVHPSRWIGPSHYRDQSDDAVPPFRKAHDIYSFGVVLVEISFWEPIFALASSQEREKMESYKPDYDSSGRRWSLAIRQTAEKELGSEMGVSYQGAALACLGELSELYDGVEKQFFWQVVDRLKHTVIVGPE